ncbi:phage integrase central domain-containing protein [Corticibacter populi]|uniref:phage integrase central domain-containing protein n=1 Tax=Corticibacter populi TaxID=1550736 RepID=UPI001F5F9FA4|nr:hypothetical protein [Corticibacter populi]
MQRLTASNPAGDTFKVVALEWYGKQQAEWSATHAERSMRQFERDLFPWFGERCPINKANRTRSAFPYSAMHCEEPGDPLH